jgi:hypothetical protein
MDNPVIFPKAYIPATDPAFAWIMAHLAQQPLINDLSTFRVSTADERESKRDDMKRRAKNPDMKKTLVIARDGASFTEDDVVAQIVPVNGQHSRLYVVVPLIDLSQKRMFWLNI